ncbi:hypothetical protein F5B19DRAFT_82168 [Rostrohypoxylon terebratum]|nr:hypothetical protein F5B19DRAFT_82168 [Rostrohypoxylon terebratum]
MGMAEFDDIEYEGVGEGRHIIVGSDRCFRDYSPGDTVISLSDDGQALYSYDIPSFPGSTQNISLDTRPQYQRDDGNISENNISSILPLLSHGALISIQKDIPPDIQAELLPLTRYCCDPQAHEQRALGLKPGDSALYLSSENPQTLPPETNGKFPPSEIYSLHLSVSLSPTPSIGPGSSSAAEQLQELLDMIHSPGWGDGMSPEEQAEHLRRATKLKRRVRSETNPRESRLPKVRKRSRVGVHDEKGRRLSS